MDAPRNTIKNTIKIPAIELRNQPDADIKTKVARKLLSFFRKGTCFLFQSTAENFGKVFYCIFRNTRGLLTSRGKKAAKEFYESYHYLVLFKHKKAVMKKIPIANRVYYKSMMTGKKFVEVGGREQYLFLFIYLFL